MKKTVKSMVDEATAAITTYSIEEARDLHGREDVQFIDIRDIRELEREGVITGAFHAPRGMLEFWVDPASPYFKPVFADESKEFILFCGAGWRSALATQTLQHMGLTNVAHIDGGFAAWKQQGAPLQTLAEHHAASKAQRESRSAATPAPVAPADSAT